MKRVELPLIGDELQQTPIGIAEVDALARTPRAVAGNRSLFDRDATALEVGERLRDGPRPLEAQVAVSRCDGHPSKRMGLDPGPMHVQLLRTEAVGPAPGAAVDQLGAHDVYVKAIRSLPVRDVDDAVVQLDRDQVISRSRVASY
jgi:hypothetical protein